ncbi:MAG: ACP S-malonyltransferase, partial [Pseudomonadota bacterium]
MQAAVPVGEGAMAAVLGLDLQAVVALAKNASSANEIVVAANDNDPAQVVISGHKSAVERAAKAAKDAGAKRALMLPVSAPFHSPLMQPAAVVMAQALSEVDVKDPVVPLVANTCAHGVTSGQVVRNGLVDQVTASVRWRESVMYMAAQGVTEVYEIGAGKALSGMIKRIDRSLTSTPVGTPDEVKAAAGTLTV